MKPFRTLSAAHDNFLRYRIHREIVLGETQLFIINILQNFLRENVSVHRTNWNIVESRPKFVFTPTFIFCSPICSNNFGVVFLWKYVSVFENWFFSFDRSNMQIFTVNITRVVWPHVTNLLDLRYFCQHNLNPLSLLKLENKNLFLGEYFCSTCFFYVEK